MKGFLDTKCVIRVHLGTLVPPDDFYSHTIVLTNGLLNERLHFLKRQRVISLGPSVIPMLLEMCRTDFVKSKNGCVPGKSLGAEPLVRVSFELVLHHSGQY